MRNISKGVYRMRSSLDITIFKNGDINICKGSMYNILWEDYVFYRDCANHAWRKGNKHDDFLASRYERAAWVTLVYFFDSIIEQWLLTLMAEEPILSASRWQKCLFILQSQYAQEDINQYDFSRLQQQVMHWEKQKIMLLEQVSWETLEEMEEVIDSFFSFIEQQGVLYRFPVETKETKSVVEKISSLFHRRDKI